MRAFFGFVLALALLLPAAARADDGDTKSHGLSLFGDLKYARDFTHFDYANPDAPKGGTVKLATLGTYDTFNPFILRGQAAAGIGELFDTLLARSADEISVTYGLIAETVELAPDHRSATFTLRPEARFHDGSPMTVDDVLWTFETLKTKGHPRYRINLADVEKAEKVGARAVRFTFKTADNREAPLYVGDLPVLSKKYWEGRDFEKTTLDIPLGSGPYKIESFEPGRSITYGRVKDYWARDLPVRRGTGNFDTMRFDYYRDRGVAFEAFKAGQYDYREEFTSRDWATGYDTPAVREGLIKKEEIKHEIPQGMQGMVYNLRKPLFQDARVRKALAYAFDFEWENKNLFYGAYTRTKSYFSNSVFASSGLPQGKELDGLEKYRGRIPDEVFTTEYAPPVTDGSGNIRDNLREALKLLKEAGWSFKGKQLVDDKTGQPFTFEMLSFEPITERIILPFKSNLERLGITLTLRNVDPTQFQNRIRDFDFDMISMRWPGSFPPGNELREFFGSEAAKSPGSYNYFGLADPTIDSLVEDVTSARSMDALVVASHALDRVLLHGYYVIPEWYIGAFRIAYWNKFQRPAVTPKYAVGFETWWRDPARETAVAHRKDELKTE
jgi:microcin C transport system substrate-binding protein